MSKLTSKIAIPVILAAIFATTVFISINYENLNVSFYIILFFLVTFSFAYGFATGQSITAPIKKLLERAKDLSSGDLGSRAYLNTKDEIGELARIFNEIAENLETSKVQTETAEKSIGVKVKARTQELEETINALDQKVKNRTAELEKLISESDKFRTEIKAKESEINQLRKDLGGVEQKTSRLGRS